MKTTSFLGRFEQRVDQFASAPAVTFEGRSLTFRELDDQANRLARHLVARGVTPNSVVAICSERSFDLAVAVLGVLKAGAGYLPLDASYPSERLVFMLEDSRSSFLIRQRGITLDLAGTRPPELELDGMHEAFREGNATRLPLRHAPDDLAYAIYTSGSTGRPKGVAMVHRALDNLIEWQLATSDAGAGAVTLQFAPLSFDVHFQEMFSTWCAGGRLVLVREELRLEMLRLIDLIEREGVSRIFLPFIALQSLADIAVLHGRIPTSLREVITAGEQLQITRAVREFFTRLEHTRLFNHYGPSETHVVTSFELEGAPESWPALPPIGTPLPNVVLSVVGDDGSSVAPGQEGELYIGGLALARGYLNRPELTAERFLERQGGRFYRTGDLVKELPGQIFQFLGRRDGQIKVRGHRVELGEIEVALSSHPAVKEVAVSVDEGRLGEKRLVAYVVPEPGADVSGLRAFALGRLPDYMVPSLFVSLSALPRTPSGKVDRHALPAPTRERPALAVEHVAPATDVELRLLRIWSGLLAVDGIGVRDGFLELGGNSLLALRAVAETQREFGRELPIVRFFEHPTISEQARYIVDPSAFRAADTRRVANKRTGERAPIAVIGMAGRFPGARSIAELWTNLRSGVDSVEVFSNDDLGHIPEIERADPSYVRARGIVADADRFDAAFFGVPPNEALVLDPQQRLLLELSWSALEDAGYAPTATGAIVGVYAGVHNNSYFSSVVSHRPDAVLRVGEFATMVASEKDYVATRIANKLNLTGPALSIHTACSTSLVAIATAVQHLRAGLCDVAIAGGGAITVPQRSGHAYQEGGMLSRDGRTRSFDADASGTVFSDGAGMVVLKPLARALADGDTVHAVIRGVGLNNDGGHKASFTAPSVEGQAAVIAMAQEDAGVSARDIQYVEAHGTGTPLGDPIEVEALSQAFRRDTKELGFCGIGSIKSNIGHLTAASGVAGLIKVALSLVHEELPPSLHYRRPNPKISFESTPFFVVATSVPWRRGVVARRAGVSSFGVGGTNAHLVVEEGPARAPSGPSIAPQLILLSAKTPAALERSSGDLAAHFGSNPATPLADVAYTLALGRVAFSERRAIVARDLPEAAQNLRQSSEGARGRAPPNPPRLAFLFPGQGAQYIGMGRNLFEGEALFRLTVDECAELLRPRLGRDLREILYPPPGQSELARAELKRTEITQTALFTVEYALARSLMAWGVEPSVLSGHSVGEFVAACLAGVFELDAALALVAARGQLMQRMPGGSMLSVRDSAERVSGYLPGELDLAAENAPGLCVVSGATSDIERFAVDLARRGIPAKLLETSHAFHSRGMDGAVADFAEALRRVRIAAPKLPIVSTATGSLLTDAEATSVDYWATHLRRTVRFASALRTLAEDPTRILLEVGPRKTLTTLALQRPSGDSRPRPKALACLSDRADDDAEWVALLSTLGRLWVGGVNVDFRSFYRGEKRQRVAIPGYSFERDRHWLDAPPVVSREQGGVTVAGRVPPASVASVSSAIEVNPMNSANRGSSARLERIDKQLRELFEQTSGSDFRDASANAHFLELGVDSLLVTQLALRLKQTFRVPVSFRQLMEETTTFAALANYLDQQLPADAPEAASAPTVAPPVTAVHATPPRELSVPGGLTPMLGTNSVALGQLLQLQMAQLTLLHQQLALIMPSALASVPSVPVVVQAPVAAVPREATAPAASPRPTTTSGATVGQVEYDPKKAFGAIARIYKQSDALSPKQQLRLDQLIQRYCSKTKTSKAHTQEHRAHHADPRVVNGFKPRIKELIYPIVTSRAQGSRLWDLDGNEYVDALNGFGSNFFGYSAKLIADALHEQIDRGFEIGPQTPLAGECAALVCELTRMDRAAFCNTGSEAVMGALRIARTVTGRSLVVAFSGSYHGIFDEVIVRDTKTMRSVPAAPGILPEAVQNILVLEYGTEQALAVMRDRADEIAAVLVEPVQSRRPDFRPKAFLEQVREITQGSGSALIFDEVITGFRAHLGGAQAYFGIAADLATYGKVLGGGMPIGVIAGRNPWMDALDGGTWQYGDASTPTAGVTYFAGTFVRHPLAMAAAHAALRYMKAEGPALQERLNDATSRLASELNAFFKSAGAPLEIRYFASLWKLFFTVPQAYGELLFCYLRDRGVHIWDGFPCFLTLAHGEAEKSFIVEAFKAAVREMQAGDFLAGGPGDGAASFDASKPPVPGARLGRDSEGNPAWFVPNPEAIGKYLQVS
jgi:amino acid adenylation domain-containing protein